MILLQAQQIAKILNAHMHSLQWIDSNTGTKTKHVRNRNRLLAHLFGVTHALTRDFICKIAKSCKSNMKYRD